MALVIFLEGGSELGIGKNVSRLSGVLLLGGVESRHLLALLVEVGVGGELLDLLEGEALGDEELAKGGVIVAEGGAGLVVREEALELDHALEGTSRGVHAVGALVDVTEAKVGLLLMGAK